MRDEELGDFKKVLLVLENANTKKEVEEASHRLVEKEVEEGFIDPLYEIVEASRLAAFYAQRVSSLRSFCLYAMKESKEELSNGAKILKSSTPGTWNYTEPYLDELKEEIKIVQEKCQKSSDKDRHHITLSGEVIDLERAVKTAGGESVKVML
jgi:hypothetical protein